MAKMFPSPKAPPPDYERTLEATLKRIENNEDLGQNLRPESDLVQRIEAEGEAQQCRDFDPYRRVLEHHGFVWRPLKRLGKRVPQIKGGKGVDGQWRHPSPKLQMAFEEIFVLSLFAAPEDLDRWVKQRKLELRLANDPKALRKRASNSL